MLAAQGDLITHLTEENKTLKTSTLASSSPSSSHPSTSLKPKMASPTSDEAQKSLGDLFSAFLQPTFPDAVEKSKSKTPSNGWATYEATSEKLGDGAVRDDRTTEKAIPLRARLPNLEPAISSTNMSFPARPAKAVSSALITPAQPIQAVPSPLITPAKPIEAAPITVVDPKDKERKDSDGRGTSTSYLSIAIKSSPGEAVARPHQLTEAISSIVVTPNDKKRNNNDGSHASASSSAIASASSPVGPVARPDQLTEAVPFTVITPNDKKRTDSDESPPSTSLSSRASKSSPVEPLAPPFSTGSEPLSQSSASNSGPKDGFWNPVSAGDTGSQRIYRIAGRAKELEEERREERRIVRDRRQQEKHNNAEGPSYAIEPSHWIGEQRHTPGLVSFC